MDNKINYWGINAFLKGTMYEIFESYAYDFLKRPTHEQVEYAKELSVNMECWPNQECVEETDNFVIVNMGKREQPFLIANDKVVFALIVEFRRVKHCGIKKECYNIK